MDTSVTVFRQARLVGYSNDKFFRVVVQDGLIAEVEPESQTIPDPPNSLVFDLAGAFLSPSFIDHHTHFAIWSKQSSQINLSSAKSAVQAASIVSDYHSHHPETQLLVGGSINCAEWNDIQLMTKDLLDQKLPQDIAVVLFLNDLHSCWCNSAALRLVDILEGDDGWDGMLREETCFKAAVKVDKLTSGDIEDQIKAASEEAAKKGITEIVDLHMDHNIARWSDRVRNGLMNLRVRCGMYSEHIQDAISRGLKSGDIIPEGRGLLTVGPYKIIADGSLGTRTACCHQPYASTDDEKPNLGVMNYSTTALESMFRTAITHNLRLAVHAIGDRANSTVLTILTELAQQGLRPVEGSSIEHAQLLRFEDLPKFAELGLAASVQPQHLLDDRELSARYWADREDRSYAFKSLADAGVHLRLGSDCPVAPLDPWMAMAAAVSRSRPEEYETSYPGWHPEQKIAIELAFQASTSGRRTKIQRGDVADLCVLARNPLDCSVRELKELRVKATMLGGKFTWNNIEAKQ